MASVNVASVNAASGERGVGSLLEQVATTLAGRAHIDDPHQEARDLVAALFDEPKHWPVLHAGDIVSEALAARALAAAVRRAAGMPLAYAVGRANFRHLTLTVDERVLIPRPETELLVDLVLERCVPGGVAVDVGTGSGAIAIALATEGKFDRVIATDISTDALDVARENARAAGAHVEFVSVSLLTAFEVGSLMWEVGSAGRGGRQTSNIKHRASNAVAVSAVVSNPPYIAFSEIGQLSRSVRDWEPAVALFSEREGMAATVQLVRQAAGRLAPGGLLALEVDARRAGVVAELVSADTRYDDVTVKLDLAGRERFVLATRRRVRAW